MLLLSATVTVGLTLLVLRVGAKPVELAIAALAVIAFVVLTLTIDIAKLPAVALVAFALFPASYLPLPTHDGAINPAIFTVIVLLWRAVRANRPIRGGLHVIPLLLLVAWVVIATVISPEKLTSLTWSLNFVFLVGVPGLLLPGWPRARAYLQTTWIALGGLLGIYAIVEFALKSNPLLGSYFEAAGLGQVGGPYRVSTTLGHYITNGLFFTMAALLGAAAMVRGRRGFVPFATVLSVVGLLLSFSRGPLIALVAGAVVLFVSMIGTRQIILTRRLLVVAVCATALVGAGGYVLTNLRGTAGASSTASHLETLQAGDILIREFFPWGGGPGLADRYKRNLDSGDKARGVESSDYQLAISLGLPGVVFAVWLFAVCLGNGLRWRPEAAALIVAYLVGTSSYNLLEANRPALLIWGLLIGLTGIDPSPAAGGPPVRAATASGYGTVTAE